MVGCCCCGKKEDEEEVVGDDVIMCCCCLCCCCGKGVVFIIRVFRSQINYNQNSIKLHNYYMVNNNDRLYFVVLGIVVLIYHMPHINIEKSENFFYI